MRTFIKTLFSLVVYYFARIQIALLLLKYVLYYNIIIDRPIVFCKVTITYALNIF